MEDIKEDNFLHIQLQNILELPLNKIEGVFLTNYEKTVDNFQHRYKNKERNEMCGSLELIQTIVYNNIIGHFLNQGKLIFSPRQLISIQNKHNMSNNQVLITRTSIESLDNVIPLADAIRAEANFFESSQRNQMNIKHILKLILILIEEEASQTFQTKQ